MNSRLQTAGSRTVIVEFPGRGDSYSDCFTPALADAGAEVRLGRYSGRWLLANLGGVDYAHFHWPSFYYAAPGAAVVLLKSLRFMAALLWMRLRGIRVLWTAHNLYPHERNAPRGIDYAMRKLMIAVSYRIFVHGTSARAVLSREFGIDETRLVSIDHGNFLGHYPMQATRDQARDRLGIPRDARVLGFIGNCRRYKNVTQLVRVFQDHFPDAWLVIAGKCSDAAYRGEIEALIARNPARIRFEPRYIDDAELQHFIRASDVVAVPFRDVLTSGSAILALSFGRPVVAPALGHLLDIVNADCGMLYDVTDADGLPRSLRAALDRQFDQETIMQHASTLRWQDAAQAVLTACQGK